MFDLCAGKRRALFGVRMGNLTMRALVCQAPVRGEEEDRALVTLLLMDLAISIDADTYTNLSDLIGKFGSSLAQLQVAPSGKSNEKL